MVLVWDGMGVDVLSRGVCGITFRLDLSKQLLHGGFLHITQIPSPPLLFPLS